MSVTASMVKELRERTGAGMMECKKALVETSGDMDAAAETLRKSGQAKADKKASRVAADGKVVITRDGSKVVIAEVNSETDFVAKDENFNAFADAVAAVALANGVTDVAALATQSIGDGKSVEEARTDLVSKVGENISVRRISITDSDGSIGFYIISSQPIISAILTDPLQTGTEITVQIIFTPFMTSEILTDINSSNTMPNTPASLICLTIFHLTLTESSRLQWTARDPGTQGRTWRISIRSGCISSLWYILNISCGLQILHTNTFSTMEF